jgi:signal transduction histidine kinase
MEKTVIATKEICRKTVARSSEETAVSSSIAGGDPRFCRGLVDGMRCGILAVDRDGAVVMINEVGRQVLGLEEHPPHGASAHAALSAHPQLVQLLLDSFTMVSLPNRAELDLHPDTAQAKRIGFTLSMIRDAAAEPIGVAVFFKDLTQIEHREEQERLKDRLAAVGQMAASLAHEIRNPLASIDVSCTLLRRRTGDDDPEVRQLLDKVTREVRRLNDTITSSLEFVRPVALRLSHDEIHPVLDEAIDVALERRGMSGIRTRRRFSPRMGPFLIDRGQLRQAFENLLLNAAEAINERGNIEIETELIPAPSTSASIPYRPDDTRGPDAAPCEQFAVVRISDDGPGIREEDRSKIFFPFFTTKKRGSGVGLSNVKKIVDSHRGLIDVDRSRHGGALFTIRLPVVTDTRESQQ